MCFRYPRCGLERSLMSVKMGLEGEAELVAFLIHTRDTCLLMNHDSKLRCLSRGRSSLRHTYSFSKFLKCRAFNAAISVLAGLIAWAAKAQSQLRLVRKNHVLRSQKTTRVEIDLLHTDTHQNCPFTRLNLPSPFQFLTSATGAIKKISKWIHNRRSISARKEGNRFRFLRHTVHTLIFEHIQSAYGYVVKGARRTLGSPSSVGKDKGVQCFVSDQTTISLPQQLVLAFGKFDVELIVLHARTKVRCHRNAGDCSPTVTHCWGLGLVVEGSKVCMKTTEDNLYARNYSTHPVGALFQAIYAVIDDAKRDIGDLRVAINSTAVPAEVKVSLEKLQDEAKTLRRGLEFFSNGDDTIQFMVSTNGQPINGSNHGEGNRLKQAGGYYGEAIALHHISFHYRNQTMTMLFQEAANPHLVAATAEASFSPNHRRRQFPPSLARLLSFEWTKQLNLLDLRDYPYTDSERSPRRRVEVLLTYIHTYTYDYAATKFVKAHMIIYVLITAVHALASHRDNVLFYISSSSLLVAAAVVSQIVKLPIGALLQKPLAISFWV
ncbi:hypothetical protein CCUS01_11456 [Colletotrichum cuscutae]|uniref:Uncharacterized protein n=1 Tax=Colletotrichum cuscutae TaxID=1209917 RepID=A0AAI9U397_9PEZI|nr:hypothetical protein CCUS01_11456 [Colletotrichum cuscutae]